MANKITKEQIDEIVKNSKFDVKKVFGKCTVVSMQLPNGFVLVESSACVDPNNFDFALGQQICKERLINRVWELEGYRLQSELYEKNKPLNCKICIVETKSIGLTVGKIYEIENGYFKADDGCEYPINSQLHNEDELREYLSAHKNDNKYYFSADVTKFVVVKE